MLQYINISMFDLFSVRDWPIERTLEECKHNCSGKTTEERKGSIQRPLLPITFEQVIIDTLHLFLRIMGLLFHQVELFMLSTSFHTLHNFEIELLCVPYFKQCFFFLRSLKL